ncbi:MAG: hypothetical protein COA58_07430 [Bacteroidetes bacterium]|nr:MAG: hypothetical protein COA58_07430 [Bacteroidota bacterium]
MISFICWTVLWPAEDLEKEIYIRSLIHFIFFIIVILLFYKKNSYYKPSLWFGRLALVIFIVLNSIALSIPFDSWLGNSYYSGYGWPFVFYEFNPFDWVLRDYPNFTQHRWYLNEIFYNLYFAAIGIAFLMSLVDYFVDKRLSKK